MTNSDTPEVKRTVITSIDIPLDDEYPIKTNTIRLTKGTKLLLGFLLVPSIFAGWKLQDVLEQVGGPKNGVTRVNVGDNCDVYAGAGPVEKNGFKYTIRVIDPHGGDVAVGLRTREVSEAEVRNTGIIPDSQVTVNDLAIGCSDLSGGLNTPTEGTIPFDGTGELSGYHPSR